MEAEETPITIIIKYAADGVAAFRQDTNEPLDPADITVLYGDKVVFESDPPTTVTVTSLTDDAAGADLFASDSDTLEVPSTWKVEVEGGSYSLTAGAHTAVIKYAEGGRTVKMDKNLQVTR